MGGQPGKPKPPGNPPTREPQRPPPVEEPPRPIPVPPVDRPPPPMQVYPEPLLDPLQPRCGPHRRGAHALTDLVAGQGADHARPDEQGHGKRRDGRQNAAQREVLKDVEAGIRLGKIFGEVQQHGV